jgi:hypothetical protein
MQSMMGEYSGLFCEETTLLFLYLIGESQDAEGLGDVQDDANPDMQLFRT